jgi:hypothetical protein
VTPVYIAVRVLPKLLKMATSTTTKNAATIPYSSAGNAATYTLMCLVIGATDGMEPPVGYNPRERIFA